jgi:hypothetical protein
VVLAEGAATVDEQAQDRELLVVDDWPQPGHPGADQRHRVRVCRVGLSSLPSGEYPCSGRELRWDIHDLLTVAQQPVRDMPADALTALDRPGPLRESPAVSENRCVAGGIGRIAATTQDRFVAGHHLDRGRPLMRVHPDYHCIHPTPSDTRSGKRSSSWEGTATSSRANPS